MTVSDRNPQFLIPYWKNEKKVGTNLSFFLNFFNRFSPYSARNNKEAHPYPCRVFTLKESFWFALTSFTPQGMFNFFWGSSLFTTCTWCYQLFVYVLNLGGGEAPKSLSGRILVAAYWLFVVLMLATFTANLAAFLTVERFFRFCISFSMINWFIISIILGCKPLWLD